MHWHPKLNQVLWLLPMTIAAVIIPFTVTASDELAEKVKTILRLQFNGYILLGILLGHHKPDFDSFYFQQRFPRNRFTIYYSLTGSYYFYIYHHSCSLFCRHQPPGYQFKNLVFLFLYYTYRRYIYWCRKFGKEGAAVASCIGYALSGLSHYMYFQKNQDGVLKNYYW